MARRRYLPNRNPDYRRLLVAGAAVLLTALLVVPGTQGSEPRAPATSRAPSPTTGVHGDVAGPRTIQGPVDGRLLNSTLSALAGVAASNVLAVDPTTQTAYSLDRSAGLLVAFNVTTGAAIGSTQIVNPAKYAPFGLALDTIDRELFVSVPSSGPVRPWVLVLNLSTLAVIANVSAFGLSTSFDPAALLYDRDSGQVFVENLTTLDTAILSPVSRTVSTVLTFATCVACAPHGWVAEPGRHTVVLSSGTASLPTINTSLDVAAAPLVAASPQFASGPLTVDNRTGTLWVANASATGDIELIGPTGTILGTVAGPPSATALAYLASADAVAVADSNASYPGSGWEVFTFRATTRASLGHYYNPGLPRWESGYAFTGLYPDPNANRTFLLTSGAGNATVQFSVNTTTGLVRPLQSYASFPDQRLGILADPANGRYYGVDALPAGITGYALANGARLWHVDLTYAASTYSAPVVVSDPAQQRLLVTYGAPFIDAYSSATGLYQATLFLPSPVATLSVDVQHRLLYAGEAPSAGDNVTVINLAASPMTSLASYSTSQPACSVAAVPALEEVAVAACNDSARTTIRLLDGLNGSRARTVNATAFASGSLYVDPQDRIFADSSLTGNVTVFDAASGKFGANWTLGPVAAPAALCVDTVDGFGLATSRTLPEVKLINLTTGQVSYKVGLPSPADGVPDFVLPNATFLVPIGHTGQTLSIAVVPLPSTPAGFSVTPGNRTVDASWTASSGSPGFPIMDYLLLDAANPNGPWTVANTTPNLTASVNGLADGATYFFAVEAESAAGTSAMSPVANATPLGVPYPPTAVVISRVTADLLVVNWSAPASTQGAPVSNYTMFYATSLNGPWTGASAGVGLGAIVNGLLPSTTYYVRVAAWNLAGISNPSVAVNATTLAGPASHPATSPPSLAESLGVLAVLLAVVVVGTVVAVFLQRRRRPPASALPIPPVGTHSLPPGPGSAPTVPSDPGPSRASGPSRPNEDD